MSEDNKTRLILGCFFVAMIVAIILGVFFRPKQNPDAVGGREYVNASAILDQKYPITKYLPALVGDCRIDYGKSQKNPNDPRALAVYVTCPPDLRDIVRIFFEEKGEDISEYEIIYRDSL